MGGKSILSGPKVNQLFVVFSFKKMYYLTSQQKGAIKKRQRFSRNA